MNLILMNTSNSNIARNAVFQALSSFEMNDDTGARCQENKENELPMVSSYNMFHLTAAFSATKMISRLKKGVKRANLCFLIRTPSATASQNK